MKRVAWWEWVVVAALVAVALFLRTRDLTAFRLSPDDGQYLYSARLHELERSDDPSRWIAEDRAWLEELASDWGTAPNLAKTYQHSYLHQFLFRFGYRLGLSPITALRTNAAVLGTLTCLALWLAYAALFPARRGVGLLAAAFVAVDLLHVFYSRTGWGQTGCTLFWLVAFAVGWKVLRETSERDTRRLLRLGAVAMVALTLAMGFQEMISVYAVAFVAIAAIEIALRTPVDPPEWRERSLVLRLLASRRLWTIAIACAPIAAYTLLLFLYSDFANARWFSDASGFDKFSWIEGRRLTLVFWFDTLALHRQISIPILVLAAVGVRALWKRDRAWLRYVALWIAIPGGMFFCAFENPSLVRIYLPIAVLACVLAAEGAADLFAWLRARSRIAAPIVGGVAGVALLAFLLAATWQTIFGREGDPLFVAGIYAGKPDSNHVYAPLYEYLEDHRIETQLGAWPARDPLFVAVEHGYPARMFSFDELQTTWTDYLLAVMRSMEIEKRRVEDGGHYKLVASDRSGRVGLYALEGRAQ